ncbi:MAG TPA: 4Fe-4S dicluster domain-containing protein [Thermoprotei archaeon]|nr:4Fe-4S dicluster domain-containing protein [Thermoprotei archaeon]
MSSQPKLWPTPYGPITQRKIFANLLKDIIRTNKCVYCSACASVCPTYAIQMLDDVPRLLGVCIKCGYCYYACPGTEEEGFQGFTDLKYIDMKVFGVERSERFGVYKKIYVVEEVEDDNAFPEEAVLKIILKYGMENGYWDAVAYAGRDEPVTEGLLSYQVVGWKSRPSYALEPSDIDNMKLKVFTQPPTILGLRGVIEELKGGFFQGVEVPRVALLGPPEHIRSIWRGRLSWAGHTKLLRTVVFMASYFHRKFFQPSKIQPILAKKGVNLSNISDVEYLSNSIRFKVDGDWIEFSYDELKPGINGAIEDAGDITGEYADVSTGRVEGVEGVIVIARTDLSHEIISRMLDEGLLKPLEFDEAYIKSKLNGLYGGV